jgi:hypothetical protein
MNIPRAFNTGQKSVEYRIVFQIYAVNTATSYVVRAFKADNTTSQTLKTVTPITNEVWYGFDETYTILKDYINFSIVVGGYPGSVGTSYIKNLQIIQNIPAEVQDSEMTWAGRRTSYYEGTKMSATDYNVDSPDTVDGGPVITVNTVSGTTPSSNPIGTSTIATSDGRAIVNLTSTDVQSAERTGRAVVNLDGTPSADRTGRGIVNLDGTPSTDGRALVNRSNDTNQS